MPNKMKKCNVYLSKETIKKIGNTAKKQGITQGTWIRVAVRKQLQAEEE